MCGRPSEAQRVILALAVALPTNTLFPSQYLNAPGRSRSIDSCAKGPASSRLEQQQERELEIGTHSP